MKPSNLALALSLTAALGALAACAPQGSTALPPATRIQPATEGQVYDVPLPPEGLPTATGPVPAAAPQPAKPLLAEPSGSGRMLTLLHTNDSRGYVDPCG